MLDTGTSASAGIHPTAVLDASVQLGENVSIGPFCVLGPNVVLHEHVTLGAHVPDFRVVRSSRCETRYSSRCFCGLASKTNRTVLRPQPRKRPDLHSGRTSRR